MRPIHRGSPADRSDGRRGEKVRGGEAGEGRRASSDTPEVMAALKRLRTTRDREDFEPIYRHFFPLLREFFLSRGIPEGEAPELAQDALLRAWANIHTFRGDGDLAAWIGRIGANLWKNALRDDQAEKRRADEVELTEAVAASGARPIFALEPLPADEKAEKAEAARRLRRALRELPARMQACFELLLGQDQTYQEIADTLGVALGTVQSQIHDGKERLRELLGRDLDGP
jgi:RNA polymerase sigma-70 factor, ECF subfamily